MNTIYTHECIACNHLTFNYHQQAHHCGQEYRWVCDHCGTQMKIIFAESGRVAKQTPTGRRCERTLALFEVIGFERMKFIYTGVAWDGELDHDYYYHEGTCPTNILKCEEIFIDGEPDRHGIFRCVKEILITGPNGVPKDEAMETLAKMVNQR